ncbi:MAG TPA: flagellar biosynthesis protein FlhA [Oligoflexia bacterium]|nr:flagellar biosynthesis protein FlhA [Oligoflexia bacterium]HMP48782.1 flagellar biosynthesis protein FlhA [Oligoflexia bacterium]
MLEENKKGMANAASVGVPLLLISIIVMMIIPIPSFLLDILLALNISISVVILFVSLFLQRPLDFTSYPSLVLMTTLFRLALNISSTRLILLNGDQGLDAAGHVIQAFGSFVLGGNFVIGVVIFIIIMMVNLMVITKGSGRIAEVAARFTLDAMPGKQMAIDSDLNSGLISEDEAKKKRKDLGQEAEFYGAMDGTSKFVRGDAIAGLIITGINIIGGLSIGVIMGDMTWLEAATNYTLLTVGDGLVSQIPALIVSVSAGIIVARAGSGGQDLGTEVTSQLFAYKKPLILSSGVCTLFAIIPGLPFLPFIALGGAMALLAAGAENKTKEQKAIENNQNQKMLSAGATQEAPPAGSTEEVKSLLGVDLLELEVGYELVSMVDSSTGGDLIDRIRGLRRQFAIDLGFIVPPIHIRDNVRLEPSQYRLMLKGVQIATGNVMKHHFLAMDPGGVELELPGIPTKESAFGLDAMWISESDKERAQFAGYTVVDPATVITTHLTEVIRVHSHEILGRQEVQVLLDTLANDYPKLVEEVVPSILTLGNIQQVLSGLLREGVSIRDLRTIIETLADWAPTTKSSEKLIEQVRKSLARSITAKHLGDDGTLKLVNINPSLERLLSESLQVTDQGSYLALEPGFAHKLISKLHPLAEKFAMNGSSPVLLAPSQMRAALFAFTERFIPGFAVLSHQEITPSTKVQAIGTLAMD